MAMLRAPRAFALLAGLVVSSFALAASANAGGLAGYTGKPYPTFPQGQSCNECHSGGTAPTVTITGPASLNAGQSANFSVVVTTGQTRAAASAAATDGVVLAPVTQNLRDSFGEMVPNGNSVASNAATFTFRATAPATGTTFRLWAVGLATNGTGNGGDRAAHTLKDVAIVGGAPPPATPPPASTAPPPDEKSGPVPGVDAGASSSGTNATPGTGTGTGTGSGSSTGTGTGTGESGDEEATGGGRRPAAGEVACTVHGVGLDGSPLAGLFAIGVAGALLFTSRRRSRG